MNYMSRFSKIVGSRKFQKYIIATQGRNHFRITRDVFPLLFSYQPRAGAWWHHGCHCGSFIGHPRAGGVASRNFPSGTDTISHSQANYYATPNYSHDLSGAVNNFHPTYAVGGDSYSSPVGSFAPNGYGLYDMAGNMWEWCWDRYGSYTAGAQTDPRGPSSGTYRVLRGGSCIFPALHCRVAYRSVNLPGITYDYFGFRVARSSVPQKQQGAERSSQERDERSQRSEVSGAVLK
jgi:Sulfatase-modifying factor enzyme 1